MLVAITGGTGFVGSFTVAAVLAQGHDVRLLVRSPDKVAPVMKLQGLDPDAVDVVVADLTDRDAIRRGLEGCDAVIDVASVFTFDPSRAEDMERINREGVDAVLGQAAELGLDPIVHVSSIVALVNDELQSDIGPDGPPEESRYPYSGSKAVQERAARALQDAGQPVVIVYPGSVLGPNDPYDGEFTQFARAAMSGLFLTVPQGDFAVCDVRDVAQVLARTIEPGGGPRRYSAAGHVVPLSDIGPAIHLAGGQATSVVRIARPCDADDRGHAATAEQPRTRGPPPTQGRADLARAQAPRRRQLPD